MHHHHNPLYRFTPDAEAVGRECVRRNVAALADYGFVFELQVFAAQRAAALSLVDACPKVTFVLQHALMPEDNSEAGKATWRAPMTALEARPNVVCKLSGLGTFLRANDPVHIAFVVAAAMDIFGPDRCLFGSNFPIEKLWTRYATLFAAYKAALGPDADIRSAVLGGTAARIYAITP